MPGRWLFKFIRDESCFLLGSQTWLWLQEEAAAEQGAGAWQGGQAGEGGEDVISNIPNLMWEMMMMIAPWIGFRSGDKDNNQAEDKFAESLHLAQMGMFNIMENDVEQVH